MWYIFDSNGNPLATCDVQPNLEDLTTRGEKAVEGEHGLPFPNIKLANGAITKVEPTKPTREELLARIKVMRDVKINDTAWVFMRQMTGTPEQKLKDEEYAKWVSYWAALRDFPDTCDVYNPVWPIEPESEVTNG